MRVSFDQSKRDRTFADRGLAFEDAAIVFKGATVEVEDTRKQYGERRVICHGLLHDRVVVVGYRQRCDASHFQHAKGQ
jgi:uncharacterized DUF497 family protein